MENNIYNIDKNINKFLFREYDLRGIYGTDITEDVAYTIGKSFGSYIAKNNENKTIVGYDNRLSSKSLKDALIKGIIDSGIDVIDIGLVTTPMYYAARLNYELNTGIMVTASHNPKEYNGFKIAFSKNSNACGKEIYDFRDFTFTFDFKEGNGKVEVVNTKENYLNLIKNSINLGDKKIKVVADPANASCTVILKEVLDLFNLEYVIINGENDGSFPNHHPDPFIKENLEQLVNKVKELKYDIGIAFDGDGDRIGLVDNLGNIIEIDKFMLIVYRDIINNMKNKSALFDVKCSKTLIDGIKDLGLRPDMSRTGASYLNQKMHSGDYDFGGEYSGHVCFKDKFKGFDDGIYAGLRMIEILSKSDKPFSAYLDNMTKYYSSDELKFVSSDDTKFDVINKIKEYFVNKKYEIIDIDGIRVNIGNGWILIRCSNTGPNITARCEADTKENLEILINIVNELVSIYNK